MANKNGDIYIYGVIRNEQSEEMNSIWGEVSLTSVKNAVKELPEDTTDITVHIHSNGGDVYEGYAIHDFLANSGKKITTIVEGMCASIATVVALAGEKRIMTKNSTFMIHNPGMGLAFGDADELEKAADYLREIEDKIINFYSAKTGQSKEVLDEWMKEEKWMTPEEALDLGFITDIAEEIKVAAIFSVPKHKQTQTITMSKETKDLLESVKMTLGKVTELFGKKDPIVENNLKLNTKDGKSIEVVTDQKIPNIDDKVLIDGKAAENGDYILMDGTVIAVTDGKVTKVTDPDGNADNKNNEEIIGALKTENENLKKELEQIKEVQSSINDTLKLIAENIESNYDPSTRKSHFQTKKADEVKDETPAQRALREKREKLEELKNKK